MTDLVLSVRAEFSPGRHQRAYIAAKLDSMGLNASIIIADTPLTDAHLAGIDLHPRQEQIAAEAVLLTPAEDRACVVRTENHTIIVDGSDALAEAIDEERVPLPGRVASAAVVSTVDFSDFRILVDGRVVRHLRQEEGEITIDQGETVAGESEFLDGVEIDGDLLIQRLPGLAGMSLDTDLFSLAGVAYTRAPDSAVSADVPAPDEPARKGFFSRLFGR